MDLLPRARRQNRLGVLQGRAALPFRWGHGWVRSQIPQLLRDHTSGALEHWLAEWSATPASEAFYETVAAYFRGGELPCRETLNTLSEVDQEVVALNVARWLCRGDEGAVELVEHLAQPGWEALAQEARV